MTDSERFFIRADYVANEVRTATPQQDYWNARRIELSTLYQYRVYQIAQKIVRRRAHARVLDVGCGTARKALDLIIPYCEYYCGIDQRSAVEYCKSTIRRDHVEFIVDDLESPKPLAFPAYDVVICADVIEHLASPDRLIAFLRGVLAPEGRLVLSTPERDILYGPDAVRSPNPDHVREWNRAELRKLLSAHGLRVIEQVLVPQFRIRASKVALRLLRQHMSRPIGYWGCQVVICRA